MYFPLPVMSEQYCGYVPHSQFLLFVTLVVSTCAGLCDLVLHCRPANMAEQSTAALVGVAALVVEAAAFVVAAAAWVEDDVFAAADVVLDFTVAALVVDEVAAFDVYVLAAPCARTPLLQLYNVGL